MSTKKIAFCHDWIYHIGGAEGVFFDLIRKYDKHYGKVDKSENLPADRYSIANIYTLFSDRSSIDIDGKTYNIYTAMPMWICKIFVYFTSHNIPILSKIFDYRNLMFWYPLLIWNLSRKINAFDPSLVVISNSACIKNIYIKNSLTYKILYLHSPLMYIRNHYDDNIAKLGFGIKQLYIFAASYLRPRDLKIRHYDEIFANSKYTAKLCHDIYDFQNIKILYPKVKLLDSKSNTKLEILEELLTPDALKLDAGNSDAPRSRPYYVYVGRLVRFSKDLDTIIYMFNDLGYELHIIGSGPDELYLKSIAKDNIKFLGYISDLEQKTAELSNAKGLINLTMESFGIITVEAMLCGLPVFGYRKGGSVELVDNQSGLLIDDKSIDNLKSEFEIFRNTMRDHQYIYDTAKKMLGDIDKKW